MGFSENYLALRRNRTRTLSPLAASDENENEQDNKNRSGGNNNAANQKQSSTQNDFTSNYMKLRQARQTAALPNATNPLQLRRQAGLGASARLDDEAADTKKQPARREGRFNGKDVSSGADWGEIAGGTLMLGLNQIAKGGSAALSAVEQAVSKPLGFVLGNDQLYKDGPFYQWNQRISEEQAANQESMAPVYEKAGTAGKVIEKFGPSVVAAAPQVAIAVLSGGGSVAAQTTAGLQAASQAPGIAQSTMTALQNMAKNPSFQYSMMSSFGNEYEQAKADGADDLHAYGYAALTGFLNAAVEFSGGIDTLPDVPKDKGAIRSIVDTALDEGKEEVIQGAISQAAQGAVYGKNNPLFSLTNREAVVNPSRAAEEFIGGAVVGGLLGGGQVGLRGALGRLQNQTAQEAPQAAPEGQGELPRVRGAGPPAAAETSGRGLSGLVTAEAAESRKAAAPAEEPTGLELPRLPSGFHDMGRGKQISEADRSYLDALGRAARAPVILAEAGSGANGWYENGTIFVAEDAEDPVGEVLRHEVTHRLKEQAPDEYKRFEDFAAKYLQERDELQWRMDSIRDAYQRRGAAPSEETLLEEVAADFAGQLMTDEQAIRRLASEDRSLAQRFYDALRRFVQRVKLALRGGEAARLDKAARLWEDALAAVNQGQEADYGAEAKYSIESLPDGKKYVRADRQVIFGNNPDDWGEQVQNYINRKIRQGEDVQLVTDDGDILTLTKETAGKARHAHHPDGRRMTDTEYETKLNAEAHIDELAQVSTRGQKTKRDVDGRHGDFASGGWNYRTAYFQDFDGKRYRVKISVAQGKDGNVVYNIGDIQERSLPNVTGPSVQKDSALNGEASANTIPQTAAKSKNNFSNTPAPTFQEEIMRQWDAQGQTPKAAAPETAAEKPETKQYSLRGTLAEARQIERIQEKARRLKDRMKAANAPRLPQEAVARQVEETLEAYSSQYGRNDLSSRLHALYGGMMDYTAGQDPDAPSRQELQAQAKEIARDILRESRKQTNPLYEEYAQLRHDLRTRKIAIAEEDRPDLAHAGGYSELHKQYFGKLTLSNSGTPVDEVYDDLGERYPELFPDDIFHPADQLLRICEVVDSLQSVVVNPYEADASLEQTASFLAGDIMERFYDAMERGSDILVNRQIRQSEAQRRRDQEKNRARLKHQREKHEQKVRELKDQYKAKNRERTERQNAAQRRETIRRHAGRLSRTLLRPTDKNHIPEELRGAVVTLLQSINLESTYELSFGTDAKYHRAEPGSEFGLEPTKRTNAARTLQAMYEKVAGEGNLVVDPEMVSHLEELAKMGDTPIAAMSKAQLDTVWNILKIVEHTISETNKAFSKGRYATISGMADALRQENQGRKDRANYAGPVGKADKSLNLDMLSPETYFHRLGAAGDGLFRQMRRAQDKQITIVKEGTELAKKVLEKHKLDFHKLEKELHTFHTSGGELTLSTAQVMDLYALHGREAAMEHIYTGGLRAEGAVKGIRETGKAAPVKVTPEDVAHILQTLTPQQREAMDALRDYLSGDLAKHGNAASMEVYGYEKFKDKNYWPIRVSEDEVPHNPGQKEAQSQKVSNYGMTKAPAPDANNAVMLQSAADTFAGHLSQMATYAGWLGTSEDLSRLYNFTYRDENGQKAGTVKTLLKSVFGKYGGEYFQDLMADIAQGTRAGVETASADRSMGRFKAAQVGANLRVILQQPTAIIRAAAMMNPKYLAAKWAPLKGWEKAKEYAPIAQWKDWGYFEMDTGRTLKELIVGTDNLLDKTKNVLMWGAGAADSFTWGRLWNAVEAETRDRYADLEPDSDSYYEKAAERFAEIIDRTQVVDSVLHRTQIMRSGNAFDRMSTSFMSEPSKIYNMVARDLYDLAGADKKGKKEAFGRLLRSTTALIASFAINAIAQSLPDAVRDDDRDKDFGEKFADAYLGNVAEVYGDPERNFAEKLLQADMGNFAENFNVLGYLPRVKDLWSLAQGYESSRPDLDGFADVFNALIQTAKAASGEGQKTAAYAALDLAAKAGDLLGLPVSNIVREAESIFHFAVQGAGAGELRYKADKFIYSMENAAGVFQDDLYRAMGADWEQYQTIYRDLVESGMEPDSIASAMDRRLADEAGIESISNLPVRFSPPGKEPSFDQLVRAMAEGRYGSWVDSLPEGGLDTALALDALEPEGDRERVTNAQKMREVAGMPVDEDVKELFMEDLLGVAQLEQYQAARKAGISTMLWVDCLEAAKREKKRRTGKSGSPSQEDLFNALEDMKLTDKQRSTIWDSYGWEKESPWG